MGFLIPFLLLPLTVAFALVFNEWGNWAHRSSEQVRLDALSLSLCHQRLHFIENQIEAENRWINRIQEGLDFAAPICLGLKAYPPTYATCVASMKAASLIGLGKALAQDAERIHYPFAMRKEAKELASKNSLHSQKGILQVKSLLDIPMVDGFEREKISEKRKFWERSLGFKYPMKLEASSHFEKINGYYTHFRPLRRFVGEKRSLETIKGKFSLRTSERQVKLKGSGTTFSACRITKEQKVKRASFKNTLTTENLIDFMKEE